MMTKSSKHYFSSVSLAAVTGATLGYLIQWNNRRKEQRDQDDKFSLPNELQNTKYTQELQLATQLALKAGQNMIPHADNKGTEAGYEAEALLDISTKSNICDFATAIDRDNEEMIMRHIQIRFPSHDIIGEEMTGIGSIPKLTDNLTWIIDPIDGTTNFTNGLPLSCVSIGLCDQKQPVMGCVYAPMTRELFLAVKGHGSYRNGVCINSSLNYNTHPTKTLQDSVVVFEFGYEKDPRGIDKLMTVFTKLLKHGIRASRSLGSGVLDLCYVASGRVDVVYAGVNNEGWKPWDYCAGVVVAQEAGAVVKSIFGRPGREGQSDEFDSATGEILDDAPDFDIYSKSIIAGITAEVVTECRNVILSATHTVGPNK